MPMRSSVYSCSGSSLNCYFLLNYAGDRGCGGAGEAAKLLFSFELCSRGLSARGWCVYDILLFSFELCMWIAVTEEAVRKARDCYFLLNYARRRHSLLQVCRRGVLLFSFELCKAAVCRQSS